MFFLKIFTKNIVKKYQIIDEERKYKNFNLKIFLKTLDKLLKYIL